ncbi:hypothetical protein FBUS_08483 [Fasciolopsis buskii]|uniref:Uncharacterized protein n=1 Tax=Fasciolopsis buskii TaxID=27845 RepID=A0A8E0RMR2_9TREM|nr:hypothetical protein FBUS_08483 [Fasciolopsis buski]
MPDSNAVNGEKIPQQTEKFIDTIGLCCVCSHETMSTDPDDPDYQRNLLRPATIKEDVHLMSQRRRVSLILKSDAFRRELEEVIRAQAQSGDYPGMSTSLLSLQHVSELFASAPAGQSSTGFGLHKGEL